MDTQILKLITLLLQASSEKSSEIVDVKSTGADVSKGAGAAMIDRYVILRCAQSGVYFGKLQWCDHASARLRSARRIWNWEGALDTLDLAGKGFSSGKMTCAVELHGVDDVLDYILVTDSVAGTFIKAKGWEG